MLVYDPFALCSTHTEFKLNSLKKKHNIVHEIYTNDKTVGYIQ